MINLFSSVSELMTKKVITISQYAPLTKVKEIFDNNKIHHIPVTESNQLVGIISKSDYLFFLNGEHDLSSSYGPYRLKTHKVKDIMTKGVAWLEPTDKLNVALAVFKENLFHAIPIVENGKLVGIITTLDIITKVLDSASYQYA